MSSLLSENANNGDILPNDNIIRTHIEQLLHEVDIDTMSRKEFTARLSEEKCGGVDLSSKKQFIRQTIIEILDEQEQNESEEEDEEEEEEEEEDEEDEEEGSDSEEDEETKPKKKGGGGGGLKAAKEISDDLASFLGRKNEPMARTQIVKALWEYIKENNLQNPKDKREIILDQNMQRLFPVKRLSMFKMNKYIGAHIHPFTPIEKILQDDSDKTRQGRATTENKRKRKRKSNNTIKKKSNGGFSIPYKLSEKLSAVVGVDVLSRCQVSKELWNYIRQHNLQNPNNKKEIICDEKFKAVMGGLPKVTIFSMHKHISPHLIEKAEPSSTKDDDDDDDDNDESERDDD